MIKGVLKRLGFDVEKILAEQVQVKQEGIEIEIEATEEVLRKSQRDYEPNLEYLANIRLDDLKLQLLAVKEMVK